MAVEGEGGPPKRHASHPVGMLGESSSWEVTSIRASFSQPGMQATAGCSKEIPADFALVPGTSRQSSTFVI